MLSTNKEILIPSVFSSFKLKGGLWTVFLFKVHPCRRRKRKRYQGREENHIIRSVRITCRMLESNPASDTKHTLKPHQGHKPIHAFTRLLSSLNFMNEAVCSPKWELRSFNKDERERAAGWDGMEEAKQCQQADKCSPLGPISCSKPHHFTFAAVRRREREGGEKEFTSTWTTAFLCLLKAHKSPPSRASFWCCRPPVCRTAPASGSPRRGRRAG